MKKPFILLALVLLAGAGIWYFNRKAKAHPFAGKKVTATYLGPELRSIGLFTRTGDTIYGTMNADGSLTYLMADNGIVASTEKYIIPASELANIKLVLLDSKAGNSLISDLEKVFLGEKDILYT